MLDRDPLLPHSPDPPPGPDAPAPREPRCVACPHCGAMYDLSRNLSARQTASLEQERTRLKCGRCGGMFRAGPDNAALRRAPGAASPFRPAVVFGALAVAGTLFLVVALKYRFGASGSGIIWSLEGGDPPGGPATPPPPPSSQAPAPPSGRDRTLGYVGSDPAAAATATRTPFDGGLPPWERAASDAASALAAEFALEFDVRPKRPFLIALEKAPQFAAEVLLDSTAEHLERLHEAIRGDFGDALGPPDTGRVLPVVILASRASYDRYVGGARGRSLPAQVGGHYEYGRRRLVLYPGPRGETRVLFHEGTHQILHHAARSDGAAEAFWFQEGIACYYEAFERGAAGDIVFHAVNRQRLPAAAEAVEAGEMLPPSELLGLTVEEFWRRMEDPAVEEAARTRGAQRLYAEAWALWHYLLSAPDRRDQARACVAAELAGEGGVEKFKALFGDLGELEKALHAHVRTLKREEEGKE